MPRPKSILMTIRRLLLCLTVLLPAGLAYAQLVLPANTGPKAPVATATPIAEERAKAEAQLSETQRQRVSRLPASRELASAESVQAADRQRLLDRLAFLQADRIKRLDELVALQKAPALVLANLPVVRALGGAPPYSAVAVDALRDELAGQTDKLKALDSGLAIREAEKQVLVEQLRRAEENARLAIDRASQAGSDQDKTATRWANEQSDLRRRVAEAELAVLAIDVDKLKVQSNALHKQIEDMRTLLLRILPAQRISEQDLETLRERMSATSEQIAAELAKVQKRQRTHQNEREALAKHDAAAGSDQALRLAFLDQALITDGLVLEGLKGLEMLVAVTSDVWQKRYIALTSDDAEQKRQAVASLNKIHRDLLGRKRLSQEQRDASNVAISDQETRMANLPPDSAAQRREREILGLLQERVRIHERLELAAGRLERQLERWLGDFNQSEAGGLGNQAEAWSKKLQMALRAFWQYELFVVEDASEVDGRRVSISYGVTVGKSIGALCLFVLGYWLFSRLAQLLQAVLIRRFGINNQLASVIRRWLMVVLAVGLVIFILNLARIPLTVFAFMGGALAIGVGFGTQTIIKNFISGIIILFERKIRVGDIIQLGNTTGHVTAVDLRATTVRGFDGVEALIPNSSFLESPVTNWTYSNHQIRRELRIGIAYGSDTRQAEALIVQAAVDHPRILKTPPPEVYFEDFSDNALLMVLIYWVELGGGTVSRRVDSDVRHTIYKSFAEAGIVIPFPQHDVHLDLRQPLPVVLTEAHASGCF